MLIKILQPPMFSSKKNLYKVMITIKMEYQRFDNIIL